MKRYTDQHEWVNIEDGFAIIGISNHAAEELGDITFVELPELDDPMEKGGQVAVVESVKAAADVYSPIGGTVCEINETLEESPEVVNQDAEGDGWICKLSDVDPSTIEDLMTEEAYKDFCNE